jgi:hypothetical protein
LRFLTQYVRSGHPFLFKEYLKMAFRKLSTLVFSAITLALMASSQPAHSASYSSCGDSFHWDSYGRGTRSAFSGKADLRPRLNDEACYQYGLSQGLQLKASSDASCDDSFARGRAEGVRYSQNQAGNACYVLGFNAGRADLNIAAREGDSSVAGSACVLAYRKGAEDYRSGLANDPTDFDGAKVRGCYGLGWYEAPLMQ